jgi:DNA-binding MarR family transcriptional regulator
MSYPTSSSPAPARVWDASHSRAVRNIATVRDRVLAGLSLTSAEWFVLDVAQAAKEIGISVGEVARAMDVQTTYVALILRHLQAKSLVTTTPSKRDRRVHLVRLTAKGTETHAQSEAALSRAFSAWMQTLDSEELPAYGRVINVLAFSAPKA